MRPTPGRSHDLPCGYIGLFPPTEAVCRYCTHFHPPNTGQYFKIVNIDKRQCLQNDAGVKLYSILLNRVAEQLVDLLKVTQLQRFAFPEAALSAAKER